MLKRTITFFCIGCFFTASQVALATPQVVGSGPMSLGSCQDLESWMQMVEARGKLIEQLEVMLAANPNDEALKKMIEAEKSRTQVDLNARSAAERTSGFLQLRLDRAYRIPIAKLKGAYGLGWIDIENSLIEGDQVVVSPELGAAAAIPGVIVVKVYGTKYCDVLKLGQGWIAAIVQSLF